MMQDRHRDLFQRLHQAWEQYQQRASKEDIQRTQQFLLSHSDALFKRSPEQASASEFSLARSVLEEVVEKDLGKLLSLFYDGVNDISELEQRLDSELAVLADGNILGSGKYQALDLDWLEAIITWLLNLDLPKPPFPQPATWLDIPDEVDIAIFGDWGGGTWEGNEVAKTISTKISKGHPDIAIHLGDVYYYGGEEQEKEHLLPLWPTASSMNFTLNSNHEMYPLGKGYFDTALTHPLFCHQAQKSFFALENSHWIIVGLDSAFKGDADDLYLLGGLNAVQTDFLKQVASRNKPVIALCHHHGLSLDGQQKTALFEQVNGPLKGLLRFWYWGHKHAAAVYKTMDGVNCRVCGHGVIPWGHASILANSQNVSWYENARPSPPDGVRVQNGFATLKLQGPSLTESFHGEDGQVHWSQNHGRE